MPVQRLSRLCQRHEVRLCSSVLHSTHSINTMVWPLDLYYKTSLRRSCPPRTASNDFSAAHAGDPISSPAAPRVHDIFAPYRAASCSYRDIVSRRRLTSTLWAESALSPSMPPNTFSANILYWYVISLGTTQSWLSMEFRDSLVAARSHVSIHYCSQHISTTCILIAP